MKKYNFRFLIKLMFSMIIISSCLIFNNKLAYADAIKSETVTCRYTGNVDNTYLEIKILKDFFTESGSPVWGDSPFAKKVVFNFNTNIKNDDFTPVFLIQNASLSLLNNEQFKRKYVDKQVLEKLMGVTYTSTDIIDDTGHNVISIGKEIEQECPSALRISKYEHHTNYGWPLNVVHNNYLYAMYEGMENKLITCNVLWPPGGGECEDEKDFRVFYLQKDSNEDTGMIKETEMLYDSKTCKYETGRGMCSLVISSDPNNEEMKWSCVNGLEVKENKVILYGNDKNFSCDVGTCPSVKFSSIGRTELKAENDPISTNLKAMNCDNYVQGEENKTDITNKKSEAEVKICKYQTDLNDEKIYATINLIKNGNNLQVGRSAVSVSSYEFLINPSPKGIKGIDFLDNFKKNDNHCPKKKMKCTSYDGNKGFCYLTNDDDDDEQSSLVSEDNVEVNENSQYVDTFQDIIEAQKKYVKLQFKELGLSYDPVDCSSISFLVSYLQKYYDWIKIGAAILTILLSALDFSKVVVGEPDKDLKKATSNLVKRGIIILLLFFLPFLVNLIIDVVNQSADPENKINTSTCGIK